MAAGKPTPSGASLTLDHVSMMVPDIGAGVAWYQDKLGAKLLDRWDNPDIGMEWAKLALGDFILELVTRPGLSADAVQAIIVALRRDTLLPLDDCLYALQPTIPHLTRSSLHRCLARHVISRLPEVEGDKPAKKRFKAYPIGYIH